MNTMIITALLAGAGLAQAGAPTSDNQCGPDCDSDCCKVKVVGEVSKGDHGKKVIQSEVIVTRENGDKHGVRGANEKAFRVVIGDDGKSHFESIDPKDMHEWKSHERDMRNNEFVMKFGMSDDGDGAHVFTMPEGGFHFEWDGEGMPEGVKEFIAKLKDGLHEGADGSHVFMIPDGGFQWKSDDGDHVLMFKGEHGDLDKFFATEGNQLRKELEIVEAEQDRPRLGVGLEPDEDGLVIVQVMEGFPAEHAGLESGDVIVTINGEGPATMDRLREALEYSHIALGLATGDGEKTITIRFDGDKGGAKKKHGEARAKFRMHSDDGDHEAGEWRGKPKMKFRIHSDDGDFDAIEGLGDMQLHLERLGKDGEIMDQVKKALHEAMGELRGSVDGETQRAIEEALRSLKDLDFDAIMKGHMGGAGKGRAHRDGDAPRARARVERLKDRAAREGRSRERVLRRAPRASAPDRSRAPRNRGDDARFKRLEDRLDRIERLLEAIERQS